MNTLQADARSIYCHWNCCNGVFLGHVEEPMSTLSAGDGISLQVNAQYTNTGETGEVNVKVSTFLAVVVAEVGTTGKNDKVPGTSGSTVI